MAADLPAGGDEAACVVCGCTEDRACEGGCSWVDDPARPMEDVCSSCLGAKCEVRIQPLSERKIRPCRKLATAKVKGKFCCAKHAAKRRAA